MHSAPPLLTRASGTSLLDVMFAISLVAFASAALFLLYSNALQLLQSQQDTEAATLCLQDRAEQLRAGNWDVLTGATPLTALLATVPANAALLPGYAETVSISAWPAATPNTKLTVSRSATGAVTLVSRNTALAAAATVRVDLRATWQGRGRTHARENSLLIAQGGVAQ